jgi:hypothetical protein
MPDSQAAFGKLWDLVITASRERLHQQYPEAVAEFLESAPTVEQSPAAARHLGFAETPLLKAIESGAAYREALFRLTTANRAAALLRADEGRVGVQESVLLDVLRIYLSGYVDATRKFIESALGQLAADDADTRERRNEVRAWAAARKKVLSVGRETVAHADTAFLSGIEEDGLWTPMILLGLAEEDALVEMYKDGLKRDHEKFIWRVGQLLQTASLAVAQGEQQLNATFELLIRKLDEHRGL